MSLWIVIRPNGPHRVGEYFRDCGPGEVEMVRLRKDARGRYVGEDRLNIILPASGVHPYAVNLDHAAGMRGTNRQFQYDPATGKVYHVPDYQADEGPPLIWTPDDE